MPMTVMNNNAAAMALGELNKNNNKLAKDLKKVSTGTRITGAGDGASDYAISEKMRVKIRGLSQDIENVQNGRSLIKTGLGGIDDIVDELRNLKELALNSCNDHNTDVDRDILQKEFDARKAHIDDVARDTNYNGIVLLDGRWRRIIPGGGFETKERLISENIQRNITTNPGTTSTVGPTTTIKTPTPTVKQTSSSSSYSSTTEVQPSHTESAPTSTVTNSSSSSQEGPTTTTISSDKVSEDPTVTLDGKRRTVVTNDTITSQKLTSTSEVQTNTTTTTTQKTITDVTVKDTSTTVPGTPTILTNKNRNSEGVIYIREDGVYEFAPDFTGRVVISTSVQNMQLQGPSNGATLNEVYIKSIKQDGDLYIKNLNIRNSCDGTDYYRSGIISLEKSNTIHLIGTNTLSDYGVVTESSSNDHRSVIEAWQNLSIVGNGSLSITTSSPIYNGAVIGGGYGNIEIGQQATININAESLSGAAIGSGVRRNCGDIVIGKDATVNITTNATSSNGEDGAAIGAGFNGRCGNITVYSGAKITTVTENGAGIGICSNGSMRYGICGDITIYSDVKLNMSTNEAACIGGGSGNGRDYSSRIGDITVYSYPNSNIVLNTQSADADKIGHGANSSVEPTSVNLLPDYNHTEGGTLDTSEMTIPPVTKNSWEVTTTVTDEVTTAPIITETRVTTNESFEEVENIITTSVYEVYEEEIPDKPGNPLIIHTGTKANQNLPIYLEDMRLDALGVADTLIVPRENAEKSLDIIDAAIDYALDQATSLGAYYNKLEFTESNLTNANENTVASESVIRDADMAKAMANYTKNNILSQAAQSMLAQANQNAGSVVSLLQ